MRYYSQQLKSNLSDLILRRVYATSYVSQREAIDQIHQEHMLHVPDSRCGFWFRGKTYSLTIQGKVTPLHPSLHAKMDAFLAAKNSTEEEVRYISAYFSSLFNHCPDLTKLYLILPNSVHSLLKYSGIPEPDSTEIPDLSEVYLYNQKGYDYLLRRLLLNITES